MSAVRNFLRLPGDFSGKIATFVHLLIVQPVRSDIDLSDPQDPAACSIAELVPVCASLGLGFQLHLGRSLNLTGSAQRIQLTSQSLQALEHLF